MSFLRKTGEVIIDSLSVTGADQAAQDLREAAQNNYNKCSESIEQGNYGRAAWEFVKGVANDCASQQHQDSAEQIRNKYR
jgi:hypothetical protein